MLDDWLVSWLVGGDGTLRIFSCVAYGNRMRTENPRYKGSFAFPDWKPHDAQGVAPEVLIYKQEEYLDRKEDRLTQLGHADIG